ncbi:MAG: Ig-like domain-containing protein, partial [bacterium]
SYTGATGTSATASALVKNSAGSAIAGVAVTFTVTGLVGAEVHTTKATVYTDVTGKAVSNISSYAAGKATVTATAGTATASDDIYFKQKTITEARTIAVAATGGLV